MPLSGGNARRSIVRALVTLVFLLVSQAALVTGGARPATAQSPPNILFILTDDQTVQELNSDAMPFLSSRPEGHWIRFANAHVNSSLCCPSRATILSGQYAHHTGVGNNHQGRLFRDSATVATWLDAAGYETALMGKYLNSYPFNNGKSYVPPGWDRWAAFRSPGGYYNYTLNENGRLVSYGSTGTDYSTTVLANKAASFLGAARQPFFLYWSPFAAHNPNQPEAAYANSFASLEMPRRPNFNEADVSDKPRWISSQPPLTQRQQQSQDEHRRSQYRTLRSVDDAIRRFFSVLSARRVLDNTVVVITSDNGHTLGEHRTGVKPCEYEECHRVPLWIRYARGVGHRDGRLVGNVDLASTFADLAGTRPTIGQDGRSLVPILDGSVGTWRDALLLEWLGETAPGKQSAAPPYWAIRTTRYKYVELATGEKELYDLQVDPYELRNVSGVAAYAQVESDLAARLARLKG